MPSPPSADHSPPGTRAADRAFGERRRQRLDGPSHRRRTWAIVGVLVVLVLLGAAFGRTPRYGDIVGDAAALRASGKAVDQRGGSICVGWPAELTISAKPPSVAPDRVIVYLTQQGWNFAMGADLVAAGATIELSSPDGPPAAFRAAASPPPGVQISASDGETATIRPTAPEGPADQPMVTTRCSVESVTVAVLDAQGHPTGPDTIGLANGSTASNPVTFDRQLDLPSADSN